MTSSYTTNSGIEKPATGDQSGTWGATVNTNMDILDTIVSGFIQVTAGSTSVNLTTTDGSVTAGMNRAIKYVDGGDLGGNCTVTITPNDQEKLIFVENGLSASRSLIFSQGSGDNFTLQNGKQAIIRSDGAGSGADVTGAYANIQISTLECEGAGAIDGALTVGGALTASGGVAATGNVTATGTVEPAGDTSAADNAAFGYTSVLGAIITGQGSTNDVTLVNDADATVLGIATGTTNVTIAGDLTISGDDLFMATNTSGAALIADGTNFNPVVISGDATIATNGALTVANDAISLAKMASGTDGQVITYDASGNPTAVGPGNDGQVLTSTGAGSPPAFEDAGGGGKVLQVVTTVKTDEFNNSDASFADVTGLTVNITPASTSNKVLVMATICGGGVMTSTDDSHYVKLVRGTTDLMVGDAADSRTRTTQFYQPGGVVSGSSVNIVYLDSPSSTSSTTYKIQIRPSHGGDSYVNRSSTDTNASTTPRGASSITVMEIDGT